MKSIAVEIRRLQHRAARAAGRTSHDRVGEVHCIRAWQRSGYQEIGNC